MSFDDPTKLEFASWQSYSNFAKQVRHNHRYVWGAEETAFLDTVRATIPTQKRDVILKNGMILYRAQQGIDWYEQTDDEGNCLGEEPTGYGRERMKPRPNRSNEGRANPAGISVLYLGTTEKTAISEVRPWIGASLSVAQFQILKQLKAIDLSRGHGQSSFSEVGLRHIFEGGPLSCEEKEKAVWIDIDNAFSRPVTSSDDTADYVPTQILAELFRAEGYDAIVYRSQFGEKGYNVAIFDVAHADAVNCAPYEVTEIEVKFKETGNRWYAQKQAANETK
jgi:RES domain